MREPIWLSRALILALHERLIAEFGGLAGIRDDGLLESALGKPQKLISKFGADTIRAGCFIRVGIVKNHPFYHGNKRTGFAAAAVFLETNGIRLVASELDATAATLALADGTLPKSGYSDWLSKNTQPAEEPSSGC